MASRAALRREKSMTFFDDSKPPTPDPPVDPSSETQNSLDDLAGKIVVGTPEPVAGPLGDPMILTGVRSSLPPPYQPDVPEDLRIPWGWRHFAAFLGFGIVSFIATQLGATLYLLSQSHNTHPTQKDLEHLAGSSPIITITANLLFYELLILFLYVSIAILRDLPFWGPFGWRKLIPVPGAPSNPWVYFA